MTFAQSIRRGQAGVKRASGLVAAGVRFSFDRAHRWRSIPNTCLLLLRGGIVVFPCCKHLLWYRPRRPALCLSVDCRLSKWLMLLCLNVIFSCGLQLVMRLRVDTNTWLPTSYTQSLCGAGELWRFKNWGSWNLGQHHTTSPGYNRWVMETRAWVDAQLWPGQGTDQFARLSVWFDSIGHGPYGCPSWDTCRFHPMRECCCVLHQLSRRGCVWWTTVG